MQYQKVLLAVDGSDTSVEAAQNAKKLLEKKAVQEITILNVVPSLANQNRDFNPEIVKKMDEEVIKNGEKVIKKIKELFVDKENVNSKVLLGRPSETICKYATENGFDLIIIGSRGLNPLSGLLLGSVSRMVVAYSPCPVLVVKPVKA